MKWLVANYRKNLKIMLSLRRAFIAQAAGMFVNNLFWAVILLLLLRTSGFTFSSKDYLRLFAHSTLALGLVRILFPGLKEIGEKIIEGEIDLYLTKPVNALFLALVDGRAFDAFGDFFFGLFLLAISGIDPKLLLFLPLSCLVILLSSTSYQLLAFFIKDPSAKLYNSLYYTMLSFALWPSFIFPEPLEIFAYIIFPGASVNFAPYFILKGSVKHAIYLALALLFNLVLALLLWRKGLERYESTGLGGVMD